MSIVKRMKVLRHLFDYKYNKILLGLLLRFQKYDRVESIKINCTILFFMTGLSLVGRKLYYC